MIQKSVAELWETAKNTVWDLHGEGDEIIGEVSLETVFKNIQKQEIPPEEDQHADSIYYWMSVFEENGGIPEKYAIELSEDDYIEDGAHRLVAAVLLGFENIPAIEFVWEE